jgi:hypothetical protein
VVSGVAGKAGVAYAADGGVLVEPSGEFAGVGLAAVESQGQGAQAAQRREGFQGSGGGAGHAPAVPQALGEGLLAGDGDAGQQVGVAADELGGAVHDHVRAEGQGVLQQRRREGVVDADDGPGVAAGGAQGRQVGHLEQRIGGGLQPEQVCAGDGGLDGRGVGQVDAVDGPARAGLTSLPFRRGLQNSFAPARRPIFLAVSAAASGGPRRCGFCSSRPAGTIGAYGASGRAKTDR